MSIQNFIPEIWSAVITNAVRSRLVYSQPGVINRDYEGEITKYGDTVHITTILDPAVRDYQKGSDITFDDVTTEAAVLKIDQAKYFAFEVDDIDKRQAMPGFITQAAANGAYKLADAEDQYTATAMAAAAPSAGELTISNPDDAYGMLVELRTKLTKANTPFGGRWVVVPPEVYASLLKNGLFVRVDASGSTDGLRNGQVGMAAGFTVLESNNVPFAENKFTVVAGHGMATTLADQLSNVEATRREKGFGDLVKSLHLYGGKVVRPSLLASALVTV